MRFSYDLTNSNKVISSVICLQSIVITSFFFTCRLYIYVCVFLNKNGFAAIYFNNTVEQMSSEYQMFLLSVYHIPCLNGLRMITLIFISNTITQQHEYDQTMNQPYYKTSIKYITLTSSQHLNKYKSVKNLLRVHVTC